MTSVSVIIPTFNCGEYIEQAIRSVYSQSMQPDKVIVVDDGSTDKTADVVRQLAIKHSSLRYELQPHAGVSTARNVGLRLAATEFVTFLDADDLWLPTMIEQQIALMQADDGIVCAFTNFSRFDEKSGHEIGDQFYNYSELSKLRKVPGPIPSTYILCDDAFSGLVGFVEVPCYTQVTLYRRNLIENIAFDSTLRLCQDLPFALQVFTRGKVAFNETPLARIRRHDNNATRDFRSMSTHKLKALRAIDGIGLNAAQRSAYHDRLVKAHIEAAVYSSKNGLKAEGLAHFRQGLSIPGSYLRKARGAGSLLLNLFAS